LKIFNKSAILYTLLAAALFGISTPISKLLLVKIPPAFMASLLYIGAGIGMLIFNSIKKENTEAKITKNEIPFVMGMIILDIAAPIFMMAGLNLTTSANASLLNNFEIVSTSLIALFIFKEAIGKRMWISIFLITVSSCILSFENMSSFAFSIGSIFVLFACICWGFENNCTRMLSLKDPLQIVTIKGLCSGTGSLIIAILLKQYCLDFIYIVLALILGFAAYGLSIYFYIKSQRDLGAARTSAYYAVAPFIGVILSVIIFRQQITIMFLFALIIMIAGVCFAVLEEHEHSHVHEEIIHEHSHGHNDNHHIHVHNTIVIGQHSHMHTHNRIAHNHKHSPDMHHMHSHKK